MANYQPFKTKNFRLKKEARDWLTNFKKKNNLGMDKYKIETNYHPDTPMPWEAVILRKV